MAQFIKKSFNKFEEKTTMEGMPCLMERRGNSKWYFSLRRITTPEFDDVVIDIHHYSPNWFFLRNGKLILNIDDTKNIVLNPHESYTDVQESFDNQPTVVTEESCFYELSLDELKQVCDAKHLDIQVTGDSEEKQMDGELFRLYARAYYNLVFDKASYYDALSSFQKMRRKKYLMAGAIIAAIILLISILSLWLSSDPNYRKYDEFNYDTAAQNCHYITAGMKYKDVVEICGKPTRRFRNELGYGIQYLRRNTDNTIQVLIYFDKSSGKVKSVYEHGTRDYDKDFSE